MTTLARLIKANEASINVCKEVIISLFIVIYVVGTAIWLLPDTKFKQGALVLLQLPWNFWGLNQNWALFAPSIRETNFHTIVHVRFKNGTMVIWDPPRTKNLDTIQQLRNDRLRKWCSDSLPWPRYKQFWPAMARFTGRKLYTPENPPEELSLYLYWARFPGPATQTPGDQRCDTQVHQSRMFNYRFKPEDFK